MLILKNKANLFKSFQCFRVNFSNEIAFGNGENVLSHHDEVDQAVIRQFWQG